MKHYREKDKEIYYKQILKVSTNKEIKILELGCTDNSTFLAIKKYFPNAKFYGTEWEEWKGKFEKPIELEELHFLDLCKEKLPYDNNFFDLIIANQVLEHLYEIDNVLEELKRILKKGGHLVAGIPNLAAFHERISILFGYNPSTWHTSNKQVGLRNGVSTEGRIHCNGFTIKGFKNLLVQHDFIPINYIVSEVFIYDNIYIPFISKIFKGIGLTQCWIFKK